MRFYTSTMVAKLLQRIASPSNRLRSVLQHQRGLWTTSLPGPGASTGSLLIKRVPRHMEHQFPFPLSCTFQRFGYSASPKPAEDANPQSDVHGAKDQDDSQSKSQGEGGFGIQNEEGTAGKSSGSSVEKRRRTKRTKFSDSDEEIDLNDSFDDLVKLVAEKEELLRIKQKEIEAMQDKVLRSYAEMENVMDRTKRESENSKKFAIQNFAKSLLDVADNLGRASSVVKESFSKINQSEDTSGAVPLLKTLLEGVEMTEKQLSEVFKKFGVEKYDPINEEFDPNRHYAVFQIPDASKAANTVAAVLKPGYVLHDRIIRPAEVGVIVSPQ